MIETIEWIACAERPVRRPVDGRLLDGREWNGFPTEAAR